MRPQQIQLDASVLCHTNCNLSNSIRAAQCSSQTESCIDQLVDINRQLIQIGFDVKRRLIRLCDRLDETIVVEADDMIKIDSDPIKIDDVIGRITDMDEQGLDNKQLHSCLKQVRGALAEQQMQIRTESDQTGLLKDRNAALRLQIEGALQ